MAGLFDDVPDTIEVSQYGKAPRASAAVARDDPLTSHGHGNAVAVARLVRIKPGSTAVELSKELEKRLPIGTWPRMNLHEISEGLLESEAQGWVRRGAGRAG